MKIVHLILTKEQAAHLRLIVGGAASSSCLDAKYVATAREVVRLLPVGPYLEDYEDNLDAIKAANWRLQ
ncbi:MAG: hypothetical protein C0392_01075 [Syntrophus sp. (in: bacteria)]|nr:hypothetical protein [Syntrophus sp. (in: bacteria)]